MARIRWSDGKEYVGDPVHLIPRGWRFKMHAHGPRWAAGEMIDVKQPDIVELAAAEIPMIVEAAQAAEDAA